MTKSEKVLALVEYFANGNKSAFAKMLHTGSSTVTNWIQRDTFSEATIMRYLPSVSLQWLLDGEGDMIAGGNINSAPTVQTPKETRPHLPVTAAAGTLGGISEGIMPRDCEQLPKIPNTPDYDFTITVSGDSMEPEFRNGDIIAAKRVCSMIEWGKPYIIDTRDGAVLKRLYEADADRLRLVSDNKAYPPIELERSEVIAAYRVISHLRPVV